MPSIYMTNCPTCGCGGTGMYIVADVEWGICSIPQNIGPGREMCRLCDYIDFKLADSAMMILPYDATLGMFTENVSPLGLQVNIIGEYTTIRITSTPPAPTSCVPDAVAFIQSHGLPSGYCYSPQNAPTWIFSNPWINVGSFWSSYLYAAPYSSCDGQTWVLSYIDNRVTLPLTHGGSVSFYTYFGTGGSAEIYGWMACGEEQFEARNYCHVPAGTPTPLPAGTICEGCTRALNARWFYAILNFYLKGTLTYYNFNV